MLRTTSLVTAGLVTLASPGLDVPAPATCTLVLRVFEARGTGPVVPEPLAKFLDPVQAARLASEIKSRGRRFNRPGPNGFVLQRPQQ